MQGGGALLLELHHFAFLFLIRSVFTLAFTKTFKKANYDEPIKVY